MRRSKNIRFAALAFTVTILELLLGGYQSLAARAGDALPNSDEGMSDEQVASFMRLVLAGLDREYPNKPMHVMTGPESKLSPRELHPAFFGSFDWHSSVHGHWTLVRLLKQFPGHPLAGEARARLDGHLTAESLQREALYFDEKENVGFERMYGWAWCLRLVAELHTWNDEQARTWRRNIRPLEDKLVALIKAYLPRLRFPIRSGVHPDTAFALAQILDYARVVDDIALVDQVVARSRDYFLPDRNYNEAYEPSGEDFFSPALNEADLMRRVLPTEEFTNWLERFLPHLCDGSAKQMLTPVEVTDMTDGKLAHLAGLNLSRAWTLRGIAQALPANNPTAGLLEVAAARHAEKGLSYVFSGHYEGEHWLATFANYAISQVVIAKSKQSKSNDPTSVGRQK